MISEISGKRRRQRRAHAAASLRVRGPDDAAHDSAGAVAAADEARAGEVERGASPAPGRASSSPAANRFSRLGRWTETVCDGRTLAEQETTGLGAAVSSLEHPTGGAWSGRP